MTTPKPEFVNASLVAAPRRPTPGPVHVIRCGSRYYVRPAISNWKVAEKFPAKSIRSKLLGTFSELCPEINVHEFYELASACDDVSVPLVMMVLDPLWNDLIPDAPKSFWQTLLAQLPNPLINLPTVSL